MVKKRNVVLAVLLAVVLPLIVVSLVCLFYKSENLEEADVGLKVIFVPGLWTEDNAPEIYEEYLKEVFPNADIMVKQWKSNRILWERAISDADLLADGLAKEIYAMSAAERRNLILVGHSLGARVVMHAMADLNLYGMSIQRGILLGAAMPDDDECIPKALMASNCPCINIVNRKDNMLSVIYGSRVADFGACALGAYGSKVKFPEMSLVEIKIADNTPVEVDDEEEGNAKIDEFKKFAQKFEEGKKLVQMFDDIKNIVQKNIGNYQKHYVDLYFDELKATLNSDELATILYPQISLGRFSRLFDSWKCVSKSYGWELRRNSFSRQFCIVNPAGVMTEAGPSAAIKGKFAELKRQLTDVDLWNNLEIKVLQDESITVEKVSSIDGVWETVEEFNGWLLQKSGETFRIVDTRDYLRASGSEEKMRDSFNSIREQLTKGILM